MLITVQFPFADTRLFTRDAARPMSVPGWPSPEFNEFLRFFGGVVDRNGFVDWIPEPRVCKAHRAVRFLERIHLPIDTRTDPITTVEFIPIARRLFFDGRAMGKLEIVFKPRSRGNPTLANVSPKQLVDAVGGLPAVVPLPIAGEIELKPCTLSMLGRMLPQQWVTATTSHHQLEQISQKNWWVASGTPIIVISTKPTQQLPAPANARNWQIKSEIDGKWQEVGAVFASTRQVGGFGSYWNITSERSSRQLERRMRITLMRLHAETTALRQILKFIASPEFDVEPRSPEFNLLELYLHDASLNVLKLTDGVGEMPQGTISDIHRVYAESTPGERDVVLDRLRNQLSIRPNYFRNLQRAIGNEAYSEDDGGERSYVVSSQDMREGRWGSPGVHTELNGVTWDNTLAREFHTCMRESFDPNSLEIMLRFAFDQRLDTLVEYGNFRQIVFDLIEIADQQGWIFELVQAAHCENPTAGRLAHFAKDLAIRTGSAQPN